MHLMISKKSLAILLVCLIGLFSCEKKVPHVEFASMIGVKGIHNSQFLYPEDFILTDKGKLYVSDALRSDIQVFDSKF